jgi:hypothetical protein
MSSSSTSSLTKLGIRRLTQAVVERPITHLPNRQRLLVGLHCHMTVWVSADQPIRTVHKSSRSRTRSLNQSLSLRRSEMVVSGTGYQVSSRSSVSAIVSLQPGLSLTIPFGRLLTQYLAYGSNLLSGLAASAPDAFDQIILTGFSNNVTTGTASAH